MKILDRLDRIAEERVRIYAKLDNATGAKKASLEREIAKLETAKAKVLEDEVALLELCALRPQYQREASASK